MIDLEQQIQECGCGGGGGAPAAKHVAKAKQLDAEINRAPMADEVLVRWKEPTIGSKFAWGKGGTRRYVTNLTGPFPMRRTDAETRFKDKVIIVEQDVPAKTAESGDKLEEPKEAEVSAGE